MSEHDLITNTAVWKWAAGLLGGAYVSVTLIIWRGLSGRVATLENEDKYIPRPECEREHDGVNNALKDVKTAIANLNTTVVNGFTDVRTEIRNEVGEVHQRINGKGE